MQWKYSENICEKWLREASEMNYNITARKIGTTRTTTSRTESTTMWTPMTTLTHRTSTIAWRITTCTEPARIVSQSLIITLTYMAQAESCTFHLISIPSMCALVVSLWLDLLHFLLLSLPPVCSLLPHLSDEQQPELYKKDMANLCDSANNGGVERQVQNLVTRWRYTHTLVQHTKENVGRWWGRTQIVGTILHVFLHFSNWQGLNRTEHPVCHLKKCWIGDKAPKNTKVELYSVVIL